MTSPEPSTAETWDAFFSDFYLRAYANEEEQAEAEAQALAAARLSGCPDGGDLLDVPCGYGRHSVPLARAGYRVTGVDRSGELLAEARRRSRGRALAQARAGRLPRAAVPRRELRRRAEPVQLDRLPRATPRTSARWPRSAACCGRMAGSCSS